MPAVRPVDALDRAELAVLARELLLAGQLIDRAGMPHLIGAWGRDEMARIAIAEWMGASPVYTRRTQRLLGFGGATIETLFKGLQLDIGAPPEFMDFRLHVIDDHHGEFWLDHCGALMDVEPMGDDYVRTMCHTIEDPTFDATAMATSPHARIRPIHRPPRRPADRHPHCHWTATIDLDREPLPEPEAAIRIARTRAATLAVPAIDPLDEGWGDYAGPLDPDLRLEAFSRSALVGLVHEIAVQSHLLVMSFLMAIEDRHGAPAAREIGAKQLTGSAGLTAERLARTFGLDGSLDAVAQVLAWHPLLAPADYVHATVERVGEALELTLHPCTATDEPERTGWIGLLAAGHAHGALGALVQGVDRHYRSVPLDAPAAGPWSWRIERATEPATESRHVALAKYSTGATFAFRETPVSVTRATVRGWPTPSS